MPTRKQRNKQQAQLIQSVALNQSASEDSLYSKRKQIDFNPKTETQSELVDSIRKNEITVAIGPAGVGKTFCVATIAAQMLINKEIDKIVLTRANVTVGQTIGMLPGTVEEKMTPLLMPILSVLKRQLGEGMYEYCLRKQKIVMLPAEYIRGLSFIDSFVIIDESQNLTPNEVKAVVTRYESGKIVLLGDPDQHDLRDEEPGIQWLGKFVKRHKLNIPCIKFGLDDIVRHEMVKKFLVALSKDKTRRSSAILNG